MILSVNISSNLANPVVVYVGIWSLVLLLFYLGLANHFVDPSVVGLGTVLFGFATSFLAYLISNTLGKRLVSQDLVVDSARRYSQVLLAVWGCGTVADVVFSRGVPIQWALMGISDRNYTDFGVPTLHGILNACYLQAVTAIFLCWSCQKNRRDLVLIGALLVWPILMLGRGIFLSALVQMLAVYLLTHKVRVTSVLRIVFLVLFIIVLFGVIGDMRDTPNPFDYIVADHARGIFDMLPSGFLWVYVYATSGLNNFLANVDTVVPVGLPIYSLSNMLPSIVRVAFSIDPRNDLFDFVDQNLNVSTFYAGAVSDFGYMGAILFAYMIQQVATYYYVRAKTMDVSGILAYSVMFQVLLFSVFYDMFFLLPTLMQLCLVTALLSRNRWRVS